jgi:hypothetical protein
MHIALNAGRPLSAMHNVPDDGDILAVVAALPSGRKTAGLRHLKRKYLGNIGSSDFDTRIRRIGPNGGTERCEASSADQSYPCSSWASHDSLLVIELL